jgi:nucleotide-binding universal stress UspA family protein
MPAGGTVFKTIAWATDLSSSAHDALTFATRLARENAARIVIIHVDQLPVGRAVITPGSNGAASAMLRRVADELREQGIETAVRSSSLAGGDVARTIADLAQDAGADVIVVGNNRHGRLARLLHGDVASRLHRTAPCPVLIVPGAAAPRSTVRSTGRVGA